MEMIVWHSMAILGLFCNDRTLQNTIKKEKS